MINEIYNKIKQRIIKIQAENRIDSLQKLCPHKITTYVGNKDWRNFNDLGVGATFYSIYSGTKDIHKCENCNKFIDSNIKLKLSRTTFFGQNGKPSTTRIHDHITNKVKWDCSCDCRCHHA